MFGKGIEKREAGPARGAPHGASGRGLRLRCTLFGAEYSSKKHSVLTQNLENKGVEFFLPARSMVLKVVTGKIL